MGIKRTFVEEEFPETSWKQSKVIEHCIKSPSTGEQSHVTGQTIDSRGETTINICKGQRKNRHGHEDGIILALTAEKKLDGSAPLLLVTDEAVGNGSSHVWSTLPGYVELSMPERTSETYIDPYVILFNCPPRKEVLIGQEHQAEVPLWDPTDCHNNTSCGESSLIDQDRRLMGSSIIPPPDSNDSPVNGVRIGRGRIDCSCIDRGSMRCVQQHVKEARENFLHSIGDEKFLQLGFCDMGEEVALKWSPDEERVFHEVVFSNPKSRGRNFWKHLRDAFPQRTMKELVSYYFNVFMLHRRAVQNRSFVLEIDSDDDVEWGSHQNRSESWEVDRENGNDHRYHSEICHVVVEDDNDDPTVESFDDHRNLDGDSSWVDDFWSHPENLCRDKGSNGENANNNISVKQQGLVEVNGDGEQIILPGQDT